AYKDQIALVEAASKDNKDISVKYAASMAGWNNTSKNYDGQLDGFKRNNVLAHKQKEEAAVLEWLRGQGDAGKPALDAYAQLQALGEQARASQARDLNLAMLNRTGTLGTAVRLYRLAIEKAKPDAQREQGYQERDLPAIEGGLKQMDRRYVAAMESRLQRYWLDEYLRTPDAQRLPVMEQWLGGHDEAAVTRAVESLAGTRLGDASERMRWFSANRKAFEASDDPAIRYAVAMMPHLLDMEARQKASAGERL